MLIGLEPRQVVENIRHHTYERLLWYVVAVCLTAIVIRFVWVFGARVALRLVTRYVSPVRAAPARTTTTVVAWAGPRGVVTLATVLALPRVTATGAPFPGRDLVIFLAFSLILVTLLGQGLTLGPLVQRLRFATDTTLGEEETRVRQEAWRAALERLEQLHGEPWLPPALAAAVRSQLEHRLDTLAPVDTDETSRAPDHPDARLRLSQEVLAAQRQAVIRLRDRGEISDEAVHQICQELDLSELLRRSRPLFPEIGSRT